MASILLIEPNIILAKQYAAFLKRSGHEVVGAQDAQEAITQTDKLTPDIVIMELLLASHSGIEFLYEFRSYTEWQHVPVIILSRMQREELAANDETLAKLGVISYLYKPDTSLKRLGGRIAAALAGEAAVS